MKVLFVCSGNKKTGIGVIVKNQGESLKKNGISLTYFEIIGKGITGYLKNLRPLRRHLKKNKYDIIHAHYSLSGFIAFLAGARPLVISLMGSDIRLNFFLRFLFKIFRKYMFKKTIVKSRSMREYAGLADAVVIPNGVDFDKCFPMDKKMAREKVGFDQRKKYIIFTADPARFEKNFPLAKQACALLKDKNADLKVVYDVEHEVIPYYMNAADVLLLTSLWEGSPNVVKEAMACNCPVAATDVGDIRETVGHTEGCYITTFEVEDVAAKIGKALAFGKRTQGREHIKHVDINLAAQKIISLYRSCIEESR